MATLTALVALSIDMILPALPAIGATLGIERANDNQLVVSLLFLGFGIGQFFYGPLSDATGRKPAAYVGLALFTMGCLLALLSKTFTLLLAGRFLQGVGVAGPRTITLALVRDRFEGREMARVMSLIMAVFILVPIVAPALGQAVLAVSGWRTIFGIYLAMGLVALIWFGIRQEETLPSDHRIPFSLRRMSAAARDVLTTRRSIGYTLAAGYVFGAFLGYLTSAQQILQQQYALGTQFPLYFAILAIAIGGASLVNASLVMRYGMGALTRWSLRGISVVSVVFTAVASAVAGHPPLWMLMTYLMVSFFGIGRSYCRHRRRGRRRHVHAHLAGAGNMDRSELQRHGAAFGARVRRSEHVFDHRGQVGGERRAPAPDRVGECIIAAAAPRSD